MKLIIFLFLFGILFAPGSWAATLGAQSCHIFLSSADNKIHLHDPATVVRDGNGNQRVAYLAGPHRPRSPYPPFYPEGDGVASFPYARLFSDPQSAHLITAFESARGQGLVSPQETSIPIFDPRLDYIVGSYSAQVFRQFALGALNQVKTMIPPYEQARLVIEPNQTFVRWTLNSRVPNDQLHLDDGTAFTVLKREYAPNFVPRTKVREGDFISTLDTNMTIVFNGNQRPSFYGFFTPPSGSVTYDDYIRLSIPSGIRPLVHAAGDSPMPVTDLLVVVGLTYDYIR